MNLADELLTGAVLFGATFVACADEDPAASAAAPTDQQLIESAMAAAPNVMWAGTPLQRLMAPVK